MESKPDWFSRIVAGIAIAVMACIVCHYIGYWSGAADALDGKIERVTHTEVTTQLKRKGGANDGK